MFESESESCVKTVNMDCQSAMYDKIIDFICMEIYYCNFNY